MPKTRKEARLERRDNIVKGLEKIVHLLEDLLILEAVKGDFDREGLRKVLGIRRERVAKISKLAKKG